MQLRHMALRGGRGRGPSASKHDCQLGFPIFEIYCTAVNCGFLTIFTAVTSKDAVKPLEQYGMPKMPIEHEIFLVFAFMDCFKSNF